MKALKGIQFVELASPRPEELARILLALGFSRTMEHRTRAIDLYQQGRIVFLVNREPGGHAARFAEAHGPSVCSMGWSVRGDARDALALALARGATSGTGDHDLPAVSGIGESLIYLAGAGDSFERLGFVPARAPVRVPDKGFLTIDHITNNAAKGDMARWTAFYKEVFGFTEVRTFDIRGEKTGLHSYALRAPCKNFSIPINEGTEAKSQINEYLEEYRGPGIQHVALLTGDILGSLQDIEGVPFLDIEPSYYETVFHRVPGVTEDPRAIQAQSVLVDGDADGYLLQIFTKNVIGPIFFEIIQRKNHLSFGEGNFGALFRSIERDQERRGYL